MHGHFRTLHINTRAVSHFQPPPFFHHYHHPPTILPSIVESLMYTDHPVLAHSRLVYRLSVINLTHAYPGTYVFFALLKHALRCHH